VEQLRLSIPRETPCAVQQWEGLIAVNYAARAVGITRHMKAPEALAKCPGLRLVHVQTLGGGVPDAEGAPVPLPSEDAPASSAGHGGADGAEEQAGSRDREKACLERYRQASSKIIGLLREKAPQVRAEHQSVTQSCQVSKEVSVWNTKPDQDLSQTHHAKHQPSQVSCSHIHRDFVKHHGAAAAMAPCRHSDLLMSWSVSAYDCHMR
jgi:hypothetical protein